MNRKSQYALIERGLDIAMVLAALATVPVMIAQERSGGSTVRRVKRFNRPLLASLALLAGVIVLDRARRRSTTQRLTGHSDGFSSGSETNGHRWFAAVYDSITRLAEALVLGRLRRQVVGGAAGRVLEIGVGTGANLAHYSGVERVVAVEPDPFMIKRARRRARHVKFPVEFHQLSAEELPFADASFDTVVATLTLCTVNDPARVLSEARRVLRPGGTFRFIEHVRAKNGLMAQAQEALTPVWSWVGAGCHLNRRTAEAITAAGFEIVELEEREGGLTPLIAGVARSSLRTATFPHG